MYLGTVKLGLNDQILLANPIIGLYCTNIRFLIDATKVNISAGTAGVSCLSRRLLQGFFFAHLIQ